MSEHQIQSAFFDIIGLNERKYPELKWLHAIPNASGIGGKGGAVIGTKFKREGRKSGVWDCFLPLPKKNYNGLYIEFKNGKQKLSENQLEFGAFIAKQGYANGVAYSVEDGLKIIESYTGWTLSK